MRRSSLSKQSSSKCQITILQSSVCINTANKLTHHLIENNPPLVRPRIYRPPRAKSPQPKSNTIPPPSRSLDHIRPIRSLRSIHTAAFSLSLRRTLRPLHQAPSHPPPLMANLHRILRLSQPSQQLGLCIQDFRTLAYHPPLWRSSRINHRRIPIQRPSLLSRSNSLRRYADCRRNGRSTGRRTSKGPVPRNRVGRRR